MALLSVDGSVPSAISMRGGNLGHAYRPSERGGELNPEPNLHPQANATGLSVTSSEAFRHSAAPK